MGLGHLQILEFLAGPGTDTPLIPRDDCGTSEGHSCYVEKEK